MVRARAVVYRVRLLGGMRVVDVGRVGLVVLGVLGVEGVGGVAGRRAKVHRVMHLAELRHRRSGWVGVEVAHRRDGRRRPVLVQSRGLLSVLSGCRRLR